MTRDTARLFLSHHQPSGLASPPGTATRTIGSPAVSKRVLEVRMSFPGGLGILVTAVVAVLFSAIPATSQVAPGPSGEPRILFSDTLSISGGYENFLRIQETSMELRVSLHGTRVPATSLVQVWLLKTDGTVVARLGDWLRSGTMPVRVSAPGVGGTRRVWTAGRSTTTLTARFDHLAAEDLAGVVIGVNGQLIVREITAQ